MRVLLSGIIGAAASAAAWFYLENVTKHELGWLAIGVGIVTGLCINAAAGASAHESIGRAALAVVLSLAAIVGGRAVYARVMQSINQVNENVPVMVAETAEETNEGEAGEAAGVVEEVEEPVRIPTGAAPALALEKPPLNAVSILDMVWMGVAALAAYITGKGRTVAVVPVEEGPSDSMPNPAGGAPSV